LAIARLLLGLAEEGVRLLARFELGFSLEGFGVALGLLPHVAGLLFGAADGFGRQALAAGDPPADQAEGDQIGRRSESQEDDGGTHRTFYLQRRRSPGCSDEGKGP